MHGHVVYILLSQHCLHVVKREGGVMDVDEILAASKSQYKSTDVSKAVELQFDLGNLLATDFNSIDTDALR